MLSRIVKNLLRFSDYVNKSVLLTTNDNAELFCTSQENALHQVNLVHIGSH